MLVVGGGGACLDIFSVFNHLSFLSHSLLEAAQYRLKYYLKRQFKPNNQPTSQVLDRPFFYRDIFCLQLWLFKISFFLIVQDYPLNPKALSLGELYGEFDLNTNEWTDGVLSSVMRQTCAGNNNKQF